MLFADGGGRMLILGCGTQGDYFGDFSVLRSEIRGYYGMAEVARRYVYP